MAPVGPAINAVVRRGRPADQGGGDATRDGSDRGTPATSGNAADRGSGTGAEETAPDGALRLRIGLAGGQHGRHGDQDRNEEAFHRSSPSSAGSGDDSFIVPARESAKSN